MGVPSSESVPIILLRGLTKSYREGEHTREVLKNLDASFVRGDSVALLGRSGSGKSTLLNLISGIDLPTSGRIFLDGADLTAMGERERTLFRRRNIGFVYQFFNLIPTLTVLENVLLPLELNHNRDRSRAVELLAEVGLEDRAGAYPDRLSGGEQQRVAITRALVHDPLLVLADEPTGNLDVQTGRQVMELLDRLVRRSGRTLILVTHSRRVSAYADRVLTIESGRIMEGDNGVEW